MRHQRPQQRLKSRLTTFQLSPTCFKHRRFAGQEGEAVKELKNRDFCACKLLILKEPQNTKINFFTPSVGSPPLNVEFAQHYLQCKSATSCFPGEVLSPP